MPKFSHLDDNELNEQIAIERGWRRNGKDWIYNSVPQPLPRWSSDLNLAWELYREYPYEADYFEDAQAMARTICRLWLTWKEQQK